MATRPTVMVTGVVAVGVIAAAITVFNLPTSDGEPSSADSTPSSTAEIARQTLVDRESHDGTLAHGDSTTISSRGSGTITALPDGPPGSYPDRTHTGRRRRAYEPWSPTRGHLQFRWAHE